MTQHHTCQAVTQHHTWQAVTQHHTCQAVTQHRTCQAVTQHHTCQAVTQHHTCQAVTQNLGSRPALRIPRGRGHVIGVKESSQHGMHVHGGICDISYKGAYVGIRLHGGIRGHPPAWGHMWVSPYWSSPHSPLPPPCPCPGLGPLASAPTPPPSSSAVAVFPTAAPYSPLPPLSTPYSLTCCGSISRSSPWCSWVMLRCAITRSLTSCWLTTYRVARLDGCFRRATCGNTPADMA